MKPQIYFKMNTFTWFVFIDLNVLFNINYALGPNKSSWNLTYAHLATLPLTEGLNGVVAFTVNG